MSSYKVLWNDIKLKAKKLKKEIYILYLASKHPKTPWYTKAFIMLIVGYAFSPVDLIPDFLPILGYLDEFIILPIGVTFAIKLLPKIVLDECKEIANNNPPGKKPKSWIAGAIIVLIWVIIILIISKTFFLNL